MLNATDCQLLIADCQLLNADCQLPIAEPFKIQETTNYNPVMYECVQQNETERGIKWTVSFWCPIKITHRCQLLIADCQLLNANYQLLIVKC